MKLFDLEDSQAGLTDSGASQQDSTPVFDRGTSSDKFEGIKF